MVKQYKPGQFVWINGQKCRVTKTSSMLACSECPYGSNHNCTNSYICVTLLPANYYPKPV